MTRLRQTIARRLKDAQNTAAMLTTFNEVDMSAVMALRDAATRTCSRRRHGVKLGFMSFFVKACVQALKRHPGGQCRDRRQRSSIYKNYYHIGVAVGTDKGLVVPVVRDCRPASRWPQIEKSIADYGKRARDGQLKIEEHAGRHLHHHQRRRLRLADVDADPRTRRSPAFSACTRSRSGRWSVGGKIEIRPMMYLALSYDHRVDRRQARR
ncbi:MAG: 2-oxo acid dehydrogenase subunit E2 [Rhodopseudomonas palustris]|nr:2-oxo acid dehydrogenase subunit E2 [Rhodopseudomonas palustris]